MEIGNKMKNISLAIIAIIGINIIIYSTFSFAMWDFNPKNWGEITRVLFSFISFVLSLIIGVSALNKY